MADKTEFGDGYGATVSERDIDSAEAVEKEFLKAQTKLILFSVSSFLILLFNIIILAVFGRRGHLSTPITLFHGTCAQSRKFSFWIHFLVNVLSTILLVGSTTGVQVVQLVRSVRGNILSNVRDILFFGFCSLPFHLFYNSAVFETVGATPFYWAVVGEEFLQYGPTTPNSNITDPEFVSVYADIRANASHWDKLSNLECIKAYGPDVVTDRRNVLAVTMNSSRPDALYEAFLVEWAGGLKGYAWMCPLTADGFAFNLTSNTELNVPPENCTISSLENGAANWTLSDIGALDNPYDTGYYPVDYCLSEPITSQCWVSLNWLFLFAVTVFNAIKAIVLVSWLREMREQGRLLTVGDMRRRLGNSEGRPRRWMQAPSKSLWILTVFLSLLACGGAGACLWGALVNFKEYSRGIDFNSLWNNGFGTISSTSGINTLLQPTGTSPVLGLSILTNTPQVALSILFFLYTALLTTMVSYTTYVRPAPTREELAKPASHLPLHYTILISAFGIVTHWMASQAFFVSSVQVLKYPPSNIDSHAGLYVNAGFSPIGIVFTMIVGGAAFVVLLGMSLRKYRVN